MAILGSTVKQPGETESYSILYAEDLDPGETISARSIDLFSVSPVDAPPPVVVGYYVDAEDSRFRVFISEGQDKALYKVEVTVSTSANRVLQDEFLLRVQDF
jgi:hypothetical protein